jgi:methyl-accepting chemotaxis protein
VRSAFAQFRQLGSGSMMADSALLISMMMRLSRSGDLPVKYQASAGSAGKLAAAAEQLTITSGNMRGGAEETARQAQTLSAASSEVSRNVSNVAATSEQLQHSIREIAGRANEATRIAKSTVAAAQGTNTMMSDLRDWQSDEGHHVHCPADESAGLECHD